VVGAASRQAMKEILERIQNGEYAREFILENRAGAPTLNARRRLLAEHDIEKVGERLRAMMPWIKKNKLVDTSRN
jgi:ketol-acid reductoisomerase